MEVLVFSDNLVDTFSKLYCIYPKPALALLIFLKNRVKDERWRVFQSIKITVNWRPIWLKRVKSQKVKRSPWLCSWRDILASFLIMLRPALRMRSGCFHTITESPAINTLFYIIIISYHVIIISIIILQCKKDFFIVSLAIIAPWGFFCLCRICRICTLGTWKILKIQLLYAYGKILHIEYCMQ